MQSEDETGFSLEYLLKPCLSKGTWQAAGGEEAVPAPCRCNICGLQGDKTNCFRPTQREGQELSNVQRRTLGQVLAGKYQERCKN